MQLGKGKEICAWLMLNNDVFIMKQEATVVIRQYHTANGSDGCRKVSRKRADSKRRGACIFHKKKQNQLRRQRQTTS